MTPQDQEEHRLAALAAGISIKFKKELGCFIRLHNSCSKDSGFWGAWVPLASKSDSFDLMVACGIEIEVHSDDDLICAISDKYGIQEFRRGLDSEVYMLAIFRCAVEIGRAKEAAA